MKKISLILIFGLWGMFFLLLMPSFNFVKKTPKAINSPSVNLHVDSKAPSLNNIKTSIHEAAHTLFAVLYPSIVSKLYGIHLCDSTNPIKPADFKKGCRDNVDDKGYMHWEPQKTPNITKQAIDFHFKHLQLLAAGRIVEQYFFSDQPQSSWVISGTDGLNASKISFILERLEPKDRGGYQISTGAFTIRTWPNNAIAEVIKIINQPKNLYIVHLLAQALIAEKGSLYETDIRYIFQNQQYPLHIWQKIKSEKINLIPKYQPRVQKIITNYQKDYIIPDLMTLESQKTAIHEAGHVLFMMYFPNHQQEVKGIHLCVSQSSKKPKYFKDLCKTKAGGFVDVKDKENIYLKNDQWKTNAKSKKAATDFEFKELVSSTIGWMSAHYFFNAASQCSWKVHGWDNSQAFYTWTTLMTIAHKRHKDKEYNGCPVTYWWNDKAKKTAIDMIKKPHNLYIIHLLANALMVEGGSLYKDDIFYIFKHQKYPAHIQKKITDWNINLLYKSNIKQAIVNYQKKIVVPSNTNNKENHQTWYLVIVFAIFGFILFLFLFFTFIKNKKNKTPQSI